MSTSASTRARTHTHTHARTHAHTHTIVHTYTLAPRHRVNTRLSSYNVFLPRTLSLSSECTGLGTSLCAIIPTCVCEYKNACKGLYMFRTQISLKKKKKLFTNYVCGSIQFKTRRANAQTIYTRYSRLLHSHLPYTINPHEQLSFASCNFSKELLYML